ncbi:MAG: ATP-binding protein [Lachnospiraceae bacterium]|nr:ATP-binding protein [Lachnospiraceae bacterium]
MLDELFFIHSNFNLPNWIDAFLSSLKDDREHPDYMRVNGLMAFCGSQGSGKTLSSVLYLEKLMQYYPQALIVTNLKLNPDFFDLSRVQTYTGIKDLTDIENGPYGVVYLLDEIQLEFNSLESKQMNMPIFEFICQQRKARKHIIGTTQVFGRLAKPFREQFKYAICCRKLIGSLFAQDLYKAENVAYDDDIRTELVQKTTKFYFAGSEDFSKYDTFEQIQRVRGLFIADGNY